MRYCIKFYGYALSLLFLISCGRSTEQVDPQAIIDRAIETHGGDHYLSSDIEFDFRDRHYRAQRNGDRYSYHRSFTDTAGQLVEDVLTNEGLSRWSGGQRIDLPDSLRQAYGNSVNSVVYFALLPYGLNDAAVRKSYVGEETLEGQQYDVVHISFSEAGGGDDFEDEFLYWINRNTHQIDFLAYEFHVDGGGLRFRRAVNPRRVGGILFQDYINYQPRDKNTRLEDLSALYRQGGLKQLSEIALNNISVKRSGQL